MSAFSNIFCSETTGPTEAKSHLQPPWDGGTKVCSYSPGLLTFMATMLIYGKNLTQSDLETYYAASGTRVLRRLFK